jgi:hypothetical protein
VKLSVMVESHMNEVTFIGMHEGYKVLLQTLGALESLSDADASSFSFIFDRLTRFF